MSEEEVKTYGQLVALLESQLESHMAKAASAFRELLRSFTPPPSRNIAPAPKPWSVAAVDGGSTIIRFADSDVAFVSTIAVTESEGKFARKILPPLLLEQSPGESDGEFGDRVDTERETRVMELAAEVLDGADLVLVDGPLIPRPKYVGEYVYQLNRLVKKAGELGKMLAGFVKRPQTSYLHPSAAAAADRALLSAFLEKFESSPWPPAAREESDRRYTYLRLLDPPEPGVFRIDFPPHVNDRTAEEVLSYIAYTADPLTGVPALLAKADEEVKMTKKLVNELYRACFERVTSRLEQRLWAPLSMRWGERPW